jgi:hypothetical protein
MAEKARVIFFHPERKRALPEYRWEELREPGTYVETGTGNLYRIPRAALIAGTLPLIPKGRLRASRLVQLSKNPFMTTFVARLTCTGLNVKFNF